MYNTAINITYNTVDDLSGDTIYREELLKSFNLDVTKFHILIDHQEKLYDIIKDYSLFKTIMINAKKQLQKKIPLDLPERTVFTFLFSYDYFYALHPFLKEFLKNKEVSIDTFNLLNNLLKNNI
ncbi:MAG: hypothetical protein CBB97_00760 [Candidatus Endolissoclinum sp. TMED37]|nr:MAG: hypothetical protein CBB97_00760 [Candidatus Endolissoclinum sp. TMED37]|tara:strand:- start:1649 stop:2020 length:372 start_codon:yes stop_codon:yes gene_type:complete